MLFFSNCEVIFICVNCESVHAEVKGPLTSFPKYKSHLKHKGTILQEYTWRLYENETMFTSKKKKICLNFPLEKNMSRMLKENANK